MKLRGTYYFVKADSNSYNEAKFTLMIDFATLTSGNQLVFQHPAILSHHSVTRAKMFRLLPKIAEDFVSNANREWGSISD